MDDDRPSLLSRLLERLPVQPLAGGDELVLREARLRPGPPVVEEGGLDLGHAGAIGIRFSGDVLSTVPRRLNVRQEISEARISAGVHVHDVQLRLRRGRRRDRRVEPRDAIPHVNVRRRSAFRRDAKHALDLRHRSTRRVRTAKANRQCAVGETLPENRFHLSNLRLRRRATAADARR
jgi:hypothetical protein